MEDPSQEMVVDAGPALFDSTEAAKRIGLKVTAYWLEQQARIGQIPYVRIGRKKGWTQAQIDQLIADRMVDPADKGRVGRRSSGGA